MTDCCHAHSLAANYDNLGSDIIFRQMTFEGVCGACTVHLDGAAVQACVTSVGDVGNSKVVTIEGLSQQGDHPVQKAWMQHNVPQCGYCQSGQMMMAAALLRKNNHPSDQEIEAQMWNICRCGTYPRIRAAIKAAGKELRK